MMDFPSAYNPGAHESNIYTLWEKSRVFDVPEMSPGTDSYFSLVVPPPNANADLHIGFGLNMAIMDSLARYNRLKGLPVLFVPGADHAGFETQSVYEKELAKRNQSRFDFSRDELYQQIYEFVAKNRSNFEKQFRRLGASVNWDRFVFTLDDKVIKQAYATFKQMWQEGLIYRSERLVNFCTFHGTSFADIEVEYKTTHGRLWYIDYPLSDGAGGITVATTRPETIFGDVAVAVNPKDSRYKHLVGKTLRLPLMERDIPVIADDSVDPKFGTGAVKITPAHDQNDFDIGQRHQLPQISVINTEGTLNHEVPEPLRGLSVREGRAKTVELLKEQGFLKKVEPHTHSVGHCYKCGTVIEPLLREQWFVDMQPLAKKAIKALKASEIKFYPDAKRRQLIRYLENLRDWNLSRQIAWGISIPAFRSTQDPKKWVFDERTDQSAIEVAGVKYERDPDVFDTWFSSSSWPYVTLDYPDGKDFNEFYPLSVMETGGELLNQWVARMIMLGLYTTGKVPFKEVYIHGYVMAEDGTKMSKSLGNTIAVNEVIDKFGADALRMGLLSGRVAAVNRGYDHRRVEEARNLTNKLWNVARFAHRLGHAKADGSPNSVADEWILQQLKVTVEGIDEHLKDYAFSEAYDQLYHFIWDDLADWYIEASKAEPNPLVLAYVLESTLKIAHPFAPFVTEAIWQQLGWSKTMLAAEKWPDPKPADKTVSNEFEKIKEIVTSLRAVTLDLGLKQPLVVYESSKLLGQNAKLINYLARLGGIKKSAEPQGLRLNVAGESLWLEVSPDETKAYAKLLEERLNGAEQGLKILKTRLKNKNYLAKAPKELVEDTKREIAKQENLTSQVKQSIEALK